MDNEWTGGVNTLIQIERVENGYVVSLEEGKVITAKAKDILTLIKNMEPTRYDW